ncbi:MAG: hypothetical protein V1918_09375 [Planctomycetota bacterium]
MLWVYVVLIVMLLGAAVLGAVLWLLYLIRLVSIDDERNARIVAKRREHEVRIRAIADRHGEPGTREEDAVRTARAIREDASLTLEVYSRTKDEGRAKKTLLP